MPETIVYYGEFGNGRKRKLFNKALGYLEKNQGEKFYYLFPNGKLIQSHRERFVEELGACFEMNLFSFDDIVDETLEESQYLQIDNIAKDLILRQIIKKLVDEGEIIYYKNVANKDGFIESVNFIIGEIKRSLLSPEDFEGASPDMGEYSELSKIYKRYEAYLEEKDLVDREGTYLKAIEILKTNKENFLDIDLILIDEFYDFRPIELEILKLMKGRELDIYINIPFRIKEPRSIIQNTLEELKDMGFEIREEKEDEEGLFTLLAKNLFDYGRESLEATDRIRLVEAPRPYLEIKKSIVEIKKLLSRGSSPEDIGVILLTDSYREDFIKLAKEERLALSIGENQVLVKIPFVREFLTSLEKNYREEEVLVRIERESSIDTYIEISRELLEKLQVKERITSIYRETRDLELYRRDLLAYEKLIEILEEIEKMDLFIRTIGFNDFLEFLEKYIRLETITLKEANPQGINIMNPLNARGFSYKDLFILGLNQGQYPLLGASNFLLRDENSRTLKDIGINYWDYGNRLDNELVKFASMVSMAERKLYLSYSTLDEGIASIFLEEILDSFKGDKKEEKLEYEKLELDYIFKENIEEISTEEEIINHLLLNIDRDIEGKKEKFGFYKKLNHKDLDLINKRIKAEYHREEEDFNEYRGKLSEGRIKGEIKDLHQDKIYSSSYLESYSRCPFAFFMDRILDIQETGLIEEEYSALEMGNIYHEVLRNYYKKYKEKIILFVKDLEDFRPEDWDQYLKRQVIEEARARDLDIERKENVLLLENIYLNLRDYIIFDLDRLKNGKEKTIPFDFEVEFGLMPEFIIRDTNRDIRLMGKIDRIDKVLEEENYILIDYKSGSSGIYDLAQMKEGLSLQIPIYMLAQGDKNIVLGAYGLIRKAELSIKLGLIDQTSLITGRNKGAIVTEERDQLLETSEENIKAIVKGIDEGDFSLKPKECSSYCIYKDICRYNHLREVEI